MHRRLCILHANCHGEELAPLLNASRAFSRQFRLERYTNYTREVIPPESLAACSALLYQYLDDKWGEIASAILRQRLSPSATAVCIPNVYFKGYWPLWTVERPLDFGDTLLNRLIDEGTPKDVILRLYLYRDLGKFVDIQGAFDETLALEREKEKRSPVKTVDFLLEHWNRTPQFYTVNHPRGPLLTHIADGILAALALPPLTPAELSTLPWHDFPSYNNFELPIHPQVAAFHNLPFGGPEQRYCVFGRPMTFAQYTSRYIDCCMNGHQDIFLGYMQMG